MAGRNISVTHVALGATRVQMTHSLQGQAIGTAAAYAVQHGLTPRQTAQPDGPHIRVIQQQLLKDDANAFGVRNEDAQDLARTARAIATSDAALDMARVAPEEWVSMETDARAMVFPSTNDRLEEAELFLGNAGDTDLEVAAELQELDQLWQREAGKIVAKFTFRVKAQSAGWVKAMPGVALHPGRPHRLALQSARNLSWARTTCHPVGVLHQFQYCSPGGCEPQNLHMPSLVEIALPAYAHWTQARAEPALATRLHPAPRPFGAANANNGYAWPFVMPNLWVSDPAQKLPQAVTLDFGAPRTFNTVYASFDTHLKHAYHDMRAFHRAHTCARNWRLLALCDGAWKQVYEEKDNYHRRRKAVFPAVTASQLRLEVLGTNATVESAAAEGDSARVYEIRVYHEGV